MRPLELTLWLIALALLLPRLPRRWEAARPWLEWLPLAVLGVMLLGSSTVNSFRGTTNSGFIIAP